MAPCTELHIPYKKYGFTAGFNHPHHLEQNFLAIERWAREQSCGGGGAAPKTWCAEEALGVIEAGSDATTTAVDVSGTTADFLVCTATIRVEEVGAGSGGVLNMVGYWVADSNELSNTTAWEDKKWTWPDQAVRVASTTCVFPASTSVQFVVYNLGSSTTDAGVRVQTTVTEALDHQSEACCTGGG